MPAPIDVQVSSNNLPLGYGIAQNLASQIRRLPDVGEVYIPQDMNYPGLRLNVDRVHAGELGLSQKDVVDNVITALNSNYMISPNYWVDYKTGNDYYLTVQHYEHGAAAIHNFPGFEQYTVARAEFEDSRLLWIRWSSSKHSNTYRVRPLRDSPGELTSTSRQRGRI